jgi:hypothetical protein
VVEGRELMNLYPPLLKGTNEMADKNISEKKKRVLKPTDTRILQELKEQTKLLQKILDITDAQWRGRNPF